MKVTRVKGLNTIEGEFGMSGKTIIFRNVEKGIFLSFFLKDITSLFIRTYLFEEKAMLVSLCFSD